MTDRIAEIRARLEGVTPGPWRLSLKHYDDTVGDHLIYDADDMPLFRVSCAKVAHFLTAARSDIPYLLDQIDAKDAEIERLRMALERVTSNFKTAVAGKPVRDMAETLAEVDAVLITPIGEDHD